jgi:hypothetical protein
MEMYKYLLLATWYVSHTDLCETKWHDSRQAMVIACIRETRVQLVNISEW